MPLNVEDEMTCRAVARYRVRLETLQVLPKQAPLSLKEPDNFITLQHCRSLFDLIEFHLQEGRREKAEYLIGFAHACLWAAGVYSLKELTREIDIPVLAIMKDSKE